MKLHYEGFVKENEEEGICLVQKCDTDFFHDCFCLATQISNDLEQYRIEYYNDEYYEVKGVVIPNVSIELYFSEEETTLEKAKENQILSSLGILDIHESWYGYSEFTIEGFYIDKFALVENGSGEGHNFGKILGNYIDKYVHFVLEIMKGE